MTAGHGIAHSERSPGDERAHGPDLSGIQTWIAMPEDKEEIDPAFEHVAKAELPLIEAHGATARIIMGELWGRRAPTTVYADTIYADILLTPGASIPIDAGADERAVYLAIGEAEIDGMPMAINTLYVLKPGVAMTLRSTGGGRVMLCGGEAFTTERHVWWNFVSSRPDRIQQAKEDWKAGRFAKVPGDEKEFIPIPEIPKTATYP